MIYEKADSTQSTPAAMTGLATLRRPSAVEFFSEADLGIDTGESFNPDILHVFQDSQDATSPDTPSSFHTFPQFLTLPLELRYLIWEAALPDPATVPRTWDTPYGYKLQRKVPSVLQACSESRQLLIIPAKGSYAASSPKYQLVQRHGRHDEGVYLNWRAESIWINRGYDVSDAEAAAYANLENLVMTWGLRPCWVESALDEGVSFLRRFPKLKLLTLLVDFTEHGWPEPSTMRGLKKLKRNEVKRIWALVQRAFGETHTHAPDWSPPLLHIVHRTANWSRREAK